MDRFTERAYGLAGMFQAATLVQQVARTGETDRFAKNASINSVLILDAVNALAVFSDQQGIRLGLKQMVWLNYVSICKKTKNEWLVSLGM